LHPTITKQVYTIMELAASLRLQRQTLSLGYVKNTRLAFQILPFCVPTGVCTLVLEAHDRIVKLERFIIECPRLFMKIIR
jgi:hypothetical protein